MAKLQHKIGRSKNKEAKSTPANVTIIKLAGGSWNKPTLIAPSSSSSDILVVLVKESVEGATFKLDSKFKLGDVVEIYRDPSLLAASIAMTILDENNNDVSPQYGHSGTVGRGYFLRKVTTNLSHNWVRSF